MYGIGVRAHYYYRDLAAIFVYRHTAFRRKAQAAMTVLLVLVLGILATYHSLGCFVLLHLPDLRTPNPISFCTGFKASITK